MTFPTIMFWVWMAAQTSTILPVCKPNDCKTVPYAPVIHAAPPAEHVIEIRTKREDKKDAIGVERPSPVPCNVNDGPYLTCITAPITHWHCADADHQLEGGFDEVQVIDIQHPNKPYCIRVTREIWIDGVKWGVLKERGQ